MNSVLLVQGERDKKEARAFPESQVADDRTLYDELIGPLQARMIRSIWRIVRRPELVEDTLQDALTLIWRKLQRIRGHPNPEALILKICLNAGYDSLRKWRRSQRQSDPVLQAASPRPAADPTRALEEKELEGMVLQAISRLPRKQAVAVMMRLVEEQSFEAIGRGLGCSEVTARIHVSKGRARLREMLALQCASAREGSR